MVKISGFQGIRYNIEKVDDFTKVVAPPYDVINEKEQQELYDKDPNNVIRLILAKGEGDETYQNASKSFKQWLDELVLIQDPQPSIYPYYQEFEFEGEMYRRKGFIAAVKVEEFDTKAVLPHERTFKKHKEDRLKLTTACNANLSQVFSVYSDSDGLVESIIDRNLQDPVVDITTQDNIRNVFWRISDPKIISAISKILKDKSVLIADGHHRYETAINFRNQQRKLSGNNGAEKPYDYVMMYLSRGEGEGLIINSTHRVLKSIGEKGINELLQKISEIFVVEQVSENHFHDLEYNQMVLFHRDLENGYKLTPKVKHKKNYKNLAVMLLHEVIFDNFIEEESTGILYTKFQEELLNLVSGGNFEAGFILPKLKASDIFDVVLEGKKMPHKTTYFYPKVLSGLVFNPLW